MAFDVNSFAAVIASKEYVEQITSNLHKQSDWNQENSESPDFIKNKPFVRPPDTLELLENKVSSLDSALNEKQYPTAQAVKTELDKKLDKVSPVLDSIPASEPDGLPPEGRVFIWFN